MNHKNKDTLGQRYAPSFNNCDKSNNSVQAVGKITGRIRGRMTGEIKAVLNHSSPD